MAAVIQAKSFMGSIIRGNSTRFFLQVSFFTFTLASTLVQPIFAAHLGVVSSSQASRFGSGSSWKGAFETAAMVLVPVGVAGASYLQAQCDESAVMVCQNKVRDLEKEKAKGVDSGWFIVDSEKAKRKIEEERGRPNNDNDDRPEDFLSQVLRANMVQQSQSNIPRDRAFNSFLMARYPAQKTVQDRAGLCVTQDVEFSHGREQSFYRLKPDFQKGFIDCYIRIMEEEEIKHASRARMWYGFSKVAAYTAVVVAGARVALASGLSRTASVGVGAAAATVAYIKQNYKSFSVGHGPSPK